MSMTDWGCNGAPCVGFLSSIKVWDLHLTSHQTGYKLGLIQSSGFTGQGLSYLTFTLISTPWSTCTLSVPKLETQTNVSCCNLASSLCWPIWPSTTTSLGSTCWTLPLLMMKLCADVVNRFVTNAGAAKWKLHMPHSHVHPGTHLAACSYFILWHLILSHPLRYAGRRHWACAGGKCQWNTGSRQELDIVRATLLFSSQRVSDFLLESNQSLLVTADRLS